MLLRSLEEAGADPEHTDPRTPEGKVWRGAWADGVPPRALGWYVVRHVLRQELAPIGEAWSLLVAAARSTPRVPRGREIPSRLRTVSFDGYHHGEVVLTKIPKAVFEPSADAAEILGRCLDDVEEGERLELPVWLQIDEPGTPVGVMSGEQRIGVVPDTSDYIADLRRLRARDPGLVADGTIRVRRSEAGVDLTKLHVHVYETLQE